MSIKQLKYIIGFTISIYGMASLCASQASAASNQLQDSGVVCYQAQIDSDGPSYSSYLNSYDDLLVRAVYHFDLNSNKTGYQTISSDPLARNYHIRTGLSPPQPLLYF